MNKDKFNFSELINSLSHIFYISCTLFLRTLFAILFVLADLELKQFRKYVAFFTSPYLSPNSEYNHWIKTTLACTEDNRTFFCLFFHLLPLPTISQSIYRKGWTERRELHGHSANFYLEVPYLLTGIFSLKCIFYSDQNDARFCGFV